MRVLVTGAAGFIGFHLTKMLAEAGHMVVGLDNINDYYDPQLKYDRLNELGVSKKDVIKFNKTCKSSKFENLEFIRLNLEDRDNLPKLFSYYQFEKVVNLAAQAGVRYSIENPEAYIDSNLVGFANLLECCRQHDVKHLIYASSSSVYGQNKKVPFSTDDNVDHPISLYAATKKSNELMAHTYSHLYGFSTTGLRFFTVYGPWGRPDMAMFLFTDAIINDKPIKVFNNGNQERDFTYIDDIVAGVAKIVDAKNSKGYSLYNIGNSKPVNLLAFIEEIERQLGKSAQKEMLPMQPGDVERTWADVESLKSSFEYKPNTNISQGIEQFVNWYKKYYK
ncbi:NAD-dependent epimerase [Salegentibacter sp. T436]|uniref:NAD-dependent epimerase n=1 Tax=Salegentibacter sp. T436 TaxID=1729720 RepID=UPI00094A1FC5|nr:NAD-dependent epimerase [Salegentibacter sp. T436]APS39301.1 capsule biosynthesis protein CapI [Salegentibacter sp. T436]